MSFTFGQVYSTNDTNFKKGRDAYKNKEYHDAFLHFERYIDVETSRSVHESREKKLMYAYVYAGFCSEEIERFEKTISFYQHGLTLARKLNEKSDMSLILNNLGMQYQRVGKFQEAIDAHKESLNLDIELNERRSVGIDYSNAGDAYMKWGDYSRALENYEKSREIHLQDGDLGKAASREVGVGEVYLRWNQLDLAMVTLQNATARMLQNNRNPSSGVMLMAEIHRKKGDFSKAEFEIRRALDYDRRSGNEGKLADRLNGLGLLYQHEGRMGQAISSYEEALSNARYRKDKDNIARILSNLGSVYFVEGDYPKAIVHFKESVELKEALRKSAFGPIRREYLSSQIQTYKYLAACYMKTNQVAEAFDAIEASRSKYLAEQIVGKGTEPALLSLQDTQELLGTDDVVLVYANADWREKILIVITRDQVKGMILDDRAFLRDAIDLSKKGTQAANLQQRGSLNFVVDKLLSKEAAGPVPDSDIFEVAINFYRDILINRQEDREWSRLFYDLLLRPVAEFVKQKQNLIISPDGLLNYLPYETLMDNHGNYVAISKDVRYTQSMAVLEALNARNYPDSRKYMLAFGGSVYNESTYKTDMGLPEGQTLPEEEFTSPGSFNFDLSIGRRKAPSDLLLTESLRSELNQDPDQSLRDTYKQLGINTMNNLPGTLYEIEHLREVVPDIKMYSKYQANEFYVKYMNDNGELGDYKVLHFATHGLTIPILPELSAVVLSIYDDERSEDGFLRTSEINELDIRADFVNLSACETGLGKIYGGEGVVGLTQSFLIAGANGLSVSLWSVADNSTAIFMVEMYRKVNRDGMDYFEAIAETKREFIKGQYGEAFKLPYYWAPFVYYGREN
ncbi:MAG: CHAT domain-containing tetratricopeptide repeat protein [Cytophagales bacterium]|nr:CHAT domain-containing tetratricopeptide repeat protein [Cytophagales bacterium]